MNNMKNLFLVLIALFISLNTYSQYNWNLLSNAPTSSGKQDDIYFVNPQKGWSVNGPSGQIFRTDDGGATWNKQIDQPGTYFRCIGFVDSLKGFAGNIGPGYFPGVTDTVAFYKTTDGGLNWSPVTNITGPTVKGLCAIDVVNSNVIYAGGRVGSPTHLIKSTDGGNTWISQDMSAHCAMILDLKFFSPDTGFVFAASDANFSVSKAKVLYTTDGGQNFQTVFISSGTNELCWKASFPTRNIGYLTILSYNTSNTQRYIAKTTDGGMSWIEMPLANNSCKEFGIGFITENVGWVGTDLSGYETTDGGNTWSTKNMGLLVNKIRFIKDGSNFVAYAIGRNIFKLSAAIPSSVSSAGDIVAKCSIFPNPASDKVDLKVNNVNTEYPLNAAIYDQTGRCVHRERLRLAKTSYNSFLGTIDVKSLPCGVYVLTVNAASNVLTQQLLIKE